MQREWCWMTQCPAFPPILATQITDHPVRLWNAREFLGSSMQYTEKHEMIEQHSFQLGLKLRLKALCFCLKDLWNTSPDCFIPFLLYVFVVRHGPSWRRTQILKFRNFLGGFRTLVDLHWNLPVFFGYTPWHSQQKKTFQNRALEDYLETKITCAKSIARWFKDIQSDLFIP